jgi:hypothetical protein
VVPGLITSPQDWTKSRPGVGAISRLAEANSPLPARGLEIGNRPFGPLRAGGKLERELSVYRTGFAQLSVFLFGERPLVLPRCKTLTQIDVTFDRLRRFRTPDIRVIRDQILSDMA